MSWSLDLVEPACATCGKADRLSVIDGSTMNLVPMYRLAGWWEVVALRVPNPPFPGGTSPSGYHWARGAERMKAGDCIEALERGALHMLSKEHADAYKKLAHGSGWGTYADAICVTGKLLGACRQRPTWLVEVRG